MLCTFFFIFVNVSLCRSIAADMTYREKIRWNNRFLMLDLVPLFEKRSVFGNMNINVRIRQGEKGSYNLHWFSPKWAEG